MSTRMSYTFLFRGRYWRIRGEEGSRKDAPAVPGGSVYESLLGGLQCRGGDPDTSRTDLLCMSPNGARELGPAMTRPRSTKYASLSRNRQVTLACLQASHLESGETCKHLIFLRRLPKEGGSAQGKKGRIRRRRIIPVVTRGHQAWALLVVLGGLRRFEDELEAVHGGVWWVQRKGKGFILVRISMVRMITIGNSIRAKPDLG